MDTLRFGVIGYGNMGTAHARWLHEGTVPGATLGAVCDILPERLRVARECFGEGCGYHETPEGLFEAGAVDAVLIATPHYDHPPLAQQALAKGLHVLIEKPAGVYTRDVRAMNEAAAASDRVFGIMLNQRTLPAFRKMRDLVQSGEAGEILRTQWTVTTWFRAQSYYDSGGWRATWKGEGGGVLINQCPHNLDIWQWTCGLPRRVRAFCRFGRYHDIEVEDDVTAYVEYENGASGVFVTSTGEGAGVNRFEVTCDRGRLLLEDDALTFFRTPVSVRDYTRNHAGGFGAPEVWRCAIPIPPADQQHVAIFRDFVRAVREGAPLLAPGEEGVRSLELSNAMQLSTWIDDWVELPIDEDLFYEKLQERIRASSVGEKKGGGKTLSIDTSF